MFVPLHAFLYVFILFTLACGVYCTPPFNGPISDRSDPNQVFILQNFLSRAMISYGKQPIELTRNFDVNTQAAAQLFIENSQCQPQSESLSNLEISVPCLNKLTSTFLCDGYTDSGSNFIPEGLKYRINVPVHSNRSIEIIADFFGLGYGDSNGTCDHPVPGGCAGTHLFSFKVGTHGQDDPVTKLALNSWSSNGWTPTGLMTLDWDGPEPDPKSFGPYPVNRAIYGWTQPASSEKMPFFTNAASIIGTKSLMEQGKIRPLRWGILIHTGEWPGWNPSKPFPYSHGCIHSAPESIKTIWKLGLDQGVKVRYPNPGGIWPYPFSGQGLLSVHQVDPCPWVQALNHA